MIRSIGSLQDNLINGCDLSKTSIFIDEESHCRCAVPLPGIDVRQTNPMKYWSTYIRILFRWKNRSSGWRSILMAEERERKEKWFHLKKKTNKQTRMKMTMMKKTKHWNSLVPFLFFFSSSLLFFFPGWSNEFICNYSQFELKRDKEEFVTVRLRIWNGGGRREKERRDDPFCSFRVTNSMDYDIHSLTICEPSRHRMPKRREEVELDAMRHNWLYVCDQKRSLLDVRTDDATDTLSNLHFHWQEILHSVHQMCHD